MLAVARALLARPRLLLLNEPSVGLAPKLVSEVFEVIETIRTEGHDSAARGAERPPGPCRRRRWIRDREGGSVVLEGPGKELAQDGGVVAAYLGEMLD